MAKYFYNPRVEYDRNTGNYRTIVYSRTRQKSKIYTIVDYPDPVKTISWARFITDYMNGK